MITPPKVKIMKKMNMAKITKKKKKKNEKIELAQYKMSNAPQPRLRPQSRPVLRPATPEELAID